MLSIIISSWLLLHPVCLVDSLQITKNLLLFWGKEEKKKENQHTHTSGFHFKHFQKIYLSTNYAFVGVGLVQLVHGSLNPSVSVPS